MNGQSKEESQYIDKQRDDNPGALDLSPGIFDFGGTYDNPAMV